MRQKLFVAVLVLITAAYGWGLAWIAVGFTRAGGVIGWGLALGVVILLVLTVWVTWREVLFGLRTARLDREYTASLVGDLTVGEDPREPRAEFEAARSAIQSDPEQEGDWRAWFRLALAYDALRDRRGARRAIRQAIELYR